MKDSEEFENIPDVEDKVAGKIMRWFGFLDDPEILLPISIISAIGSLLIWLAVFFFPQTISIVLAFLMGDSNGGEYPMLFFSGILLIALTFILPFLAVYALARRRQPAIEEETKIEKGMMAGYAYRSRSDNRWRGWILAGMAGVLHFMLIMFIYWARY